MTYQVKADALARLTADGNVAEQILWSDITDAAVIDTSIRNGQRVRRVDLFHGADRDRLSIGCSSLYASSQPGVDAAAHIALMAQIADRLGRDRPGFDISWGESGKGRLAMFGIGALTVVAAVAFIILVLANGVSDDRLWVVAVPVGVMLIFGLSLVYKHAPWRDVPRLNARVVAEILRQSAGLSAR